MTSSPDAAPLILAPAGNRAAFLAAVDAGADAVYCGMKSFSARAAAKNFTIPDLARLAGFAQERGVRVHIPFNIMLRPHELAEAAGRLASLAREVKPDAVIIQDPALIPLTRQAGYGGELHLSTLANISFPAALPWIRNRWKGRISAVVLPRELNIDEIRAAAAAAGPDGPELEVFVHGALCFAVSGRCYWSSWLGGKSGLRGRCVQPCRRVYAGGEPPRGRFFSCRDLSLDTLVKVLRQIPEIRTWKIEGRKKGAHYVHYTVRAYRLLRDHFSDAQAKKDALSLLEMSLGRPGTHYFFLPQRPRVPVEPGCPAGSGFLLGRIKGPRNRGFLMPRIPLLPGDTVRVGYEDSPKHALISPNRSIPKGGKYLLPPKAAGAASGTPVFLTDRREPALAKRLAGLEASLPPETGEKTPPSVRLRLPRPSRRRGKIREMMVSRRVDQRGQKGHASACWLPDAADQLPPGRFAAGIWWWLPPVIWPENESGAADMIQTLLNRKARRFVLNAPWQRAFFPSSAKDLELWTGPFCNIANPLAAGEMAESGFSGLIVSPELGLEDYRALGAASPLPLGIVCRGHWPVCVSRVQPEELAGAPRVASPRDEGFWSVRRANLLWVYPEWRLDFAPRRRQLEQAGFQLFVELRETVPRGIRLKRRPGLWNLESGPE